MLIVLKEPSCEISMIYSEELKAEIISENNNYFDVSYKYYNDEGILEDAECVYTKDKYTYIILPDSDFIKSTLSKCPYEYDNYIFLKSVKHMIKEYPDVYDNNLNTLLTDIDIQITIEKIQIDINYYKNGIFGREPYFIPSIGYNLDKISSIDVSQAILILEFELEGLKAKLNLIAEKRRSGEYKYVIS